MQIRYKKLNPDVPDLRHATLGSAGIDLYAMGFMAKHVGESAYAIIEIHTGIAIEIPENHVGLLFIRSSISNKLMLANGVGVIDSDYRGEIILKTTGALFDGPDEMDELLDKRVAQLVIVPYVKAEMIEVNNLSETLRGDGAFGSTGLEDLIPIPIKLSEDEFGQFCQAVFDDRINKD